jgi:hypothetical protein
MTRSILSGMLGLISVLAVGVLPVACQSGGVGDPCVPEDEYNTEFAGFKLTEENIESRSFQCQTRICLVNHFQGRVSCPYGQAASPGGKAPDGKCQTPTSTSADKDLPCCVPGTDDMITAEVCTQCNDASPRGADQSVYCSCRCGVAEGEPADPNFNFCECPSGYSCSQIRPNIGLGDKQLTGKYCIKDGTWWDDPKKNNKEGSCGSVQGHLNATVCKGTAAATQ